MERGAQALYMVFVLVAVAASMGASRDAAAQSETAKPGNGDDLRAAFATVVDVAEGRRIAESCSRCHGVNGISSMKGVPHVAGQRPAYLYTKLRAYKTGVYPKHEMEDKVKFLSDDALVKVAAYYATLDPAPPLKVRGAKVVPARADPVAAGKAASSGCAGCHGDSGVTKTPGMPSLVGLDPKYLIVAMTGYTSGQRKHDMMKTFVAPLTDIDISNIALYYALQKPARAQTPAPGDQAAGKKAAAACAGCHGEQGVSGNPANPSLAGQDAEYFAAAMRAYKDGSRKEGTMKNVVAAIDDRTINDLAAYYAAQQPRAPKVVKMLTTAEWVSRCDRCHGINGNSTDPRSPALAAQRVDYLDKMLRAYQSGARKNSVMAAMSGTLRESDIASLALYYARQKARAFVYVALPCK